MSRESILIIEDEEDIQELMRYNLEREGYRVQCVASGEEGIARARQIMPDLIILDLMLPGIEGFEVCRALKEERSTRSISLIMVTAKSEESDVVSGLELGADDYITKPFSPKILIARVKSTLRKRRSRPADTTAVINLHGMQIDPNRREVTVQGKRVVLTNSEFRILHFFANKPGWVFSRSQIVDAVHGEDYPVTERSVDVQIVGLRKKLGPTGAYIETVRGAGYRIKEPAQSKSTGST